MSWIRTASSTGTVHFDDVLGMRPNLHETYQAFEAKLWNAVDPVVLELCRLRVAQLHRCPAALAARTPVAVAAGLTEAMVEALSDWPSHPAFSEIARACLQFSEKFVIDPHSVTDDDAAAIQAHWSPAQFVALTEALAIFDGMTRFRVMLGVEAD